MTRPRLACVTSFECAEICVVPFVGPSGEPSPSLFHLRLLHAYLHDLLRAPSVSLSVAGEPIRVRLRVVAAEAEIRKRPNMEHLKRRFILQCSEEAKADADSGARPRCSPVPLSRGDIVADELVALQGHGETFASTAMPTLPLLRRSGLALDFLFRIAALGMGGSSVGDVVCAARMTITYSTHQSRAYLE